MESGSGYVRKRLGSSPEQQETGTAAWISRKGQTAARSCRKDQGRYQKQKISIGQIPDDKQDERERIRRVSWEKRHLYGGRRWWEQQFWL